MKNAGAKLSARPRVLLDFGPVRLPQLVDLSLLRRERAAETAVRLEQTQRPLELPAGVVRGLGRPAESVHDGFQLLALLQRQHQALPRFE